jgi:hypothetical protein
MNLPDDVGPTENDTDLPLTQSVNGGNHGGAPLFDPDNPWLLLEQAAEPLPEPPTDVLDADAVLAWIEHVQRRLLYRRDRCRLAREAMRVVAARRDRSLGHEVGRLVLEEVARRGSPAAMIDRGRRVGEAGRRATVFARLVVSQPTWQEFRGLALERNITVARYVGVLVERETER